MKKIIFMLDEEWEIIKNYSSYSVSNYGEVKRMMKGKSTFLGKILKPSLKNGYPIVSLLENGKKKDFYIHRLVIETFLGPCPNGKEVNHIDGDKENPYIKNLEYVTRSENCKHAFRIGLRNNKGEDHPQSKLINKDVKKIKKLYGSGEFTQCQIAKRFKISQSCVSFIINNKIWMN